MINIESLENCCGCAACVNVCPKQCIIMRPDKKGFFYPQIDTDLCIHCNLCEKVCPIINRTDSIRPIMVEAMKSKSVKDVKLSSSGAICYELSRYFINNGGVVYGAAWTENLTVRHIRVTDNAVLEKIRGSKYLQSEIGDILKTAKADLVDKKNVLFIGTPCQVAGMKRYLRKEYRNLTTIDFVCHDVPSQVIFNRIITDLEKRNGSRVQEVNFRSKKKSWREFGTDFKLQNGINIYIRNSKSVFYRGFMSNLYLRDCCYKCPFTDNRNYSDITVADLWGVEFVRPEIDDNTGINLVLVRSQQGRELFDNCSVLFNRFGYDYQDALKYNPAIEIPPKCHPFSIWYWKYLIKLPVRYGILLALLSGRILGYLKKKNDE